MSQRWNSGSSVGEGFYYENFGNVHFFNFFLTDIETNENVWVSAQGTESECYQGNGVYIIPAFVYIANVPTQVGTVELKVQGNAQIDVLGVLCDWNTPNGNSHRIRERMINCTPTNDVCPPGGPVEPPPFNGWTDSPGRLNPVLMDFQTIWGSPYLQVGPRVMINIQKSVSIQESVFDVASIRCVAPPADAPQKFGSFNHNLDNGSCFMWWSTRPADLLEFDGIPGWASADQIGWQLNTLTGRDHFPMEPNGVYYLNIAFIQGWPNGDWKGAVQLLREGNPVFLRDSQIQPAQEYTGVNTYWGASQFA
jgi:hypothetical protein